MLIQNNNLTNSSILVTFADTSALEADMGFKPNTPLREGLRRFAQWYKEYYKIGD